VLDEERTRSVNSTPDQWIMFMFYQLRTVLRVSFSDLTLLLQSEATNGNENLGVEVGIADKKWGSMTPTFSSTPGHLTTWTP